MCVSVFNSLWKSYPCRGGRKLKKSEAQKYFSKNFSEKEYPLLERAVKNYANCENTLRGVGIMDMIRFLRPARNGKDKLTVPWREYVNDSDETQGDEESRTKAARLEYREMKNRNAGRTPEEDEKLRVYLAKKYKISHKVSLEVCNE